MKKTDLPYNSYSKNHQSNPKSSVNASAPKTFKERIRWLFTKDGSPTLLVIIVGFVVGFFVDGAVGIILSTVLGLVILSFLKKWHLPTKPWQSTVSTLLPIIARLAFMMVFFLPIADYLMMPSGHSPNTLMKYLSIMVVKPVNIYSNAPADNVFPGIPIIVAISVILMLWGSLNLGKRKNFVIAFVGLLLYTLSPTIASITYGYSALRIDFTFFAIGYYLAWVGLILIVINGVLPRILKTPASLQPSPIVQRANRLMSIMPFIGIGLFLTQLQNIHFHLSIIAFQDLSPEFEAAHHEVAGILSGAIAGVSAGIIIDNVVSTSPPDNSGNNPPDLTTPPDAPTVPTPPQDTSPPPSTPPEEPPNIDDIKEIEHRKELEIEQHRIDEQYKSAHDKDWQKSINDDTTKAANDDKALQDIRDHAHDDTKKFYNEFYKQENEFNSWEAEHELKNAENMETLMHAAEYTKKGCDTLITIGKYTLPGGKQISDAYEVTSEFAEGTSEGGLKQGIEKAGIKVGEKVLEHVTMHKLEHSLKGTDAGEFVHYINEEGEPVSNVKDFTVEWTKDKIKGAGPEALGDWAKKKMGLEESEGGTEGGSHGAEGGAPASAE